MDEPFPSRSAALGILGKVAVAVSPASSSRVFALIKAEFTLLPDELAVCLATLGGAICPDLPALNRLLAVRKLLPVVDPGARAQPGFQGGEPCRTTRDVTPEQGSWWRLRE